eukprot:6219564-Amphidinium_carterae.1
MPIDLIHGGQLVWPLSDGEATAPKGDQVKLDWFPCSKPLAPLCGLEEAADLKPDHVARIYEEPQITDKWEVQASYLAARANNAGAWILALKENVDEFWELWCGFSEQALPLGTRGRFLFSQRQQAAPAPADEALAVAKQHSLVAELKR